MDDLKEGFQSFLAKSPFGDAPVQVHFHLIVRDDLVAEHGDYLEKVRDGLGKHCSALATSIELSMALQSEGKQSGLEREVAGGQEARGSTNDGIP